MLAGVLYYHRKAAEGRDRTRPLEGNQHASVEAFQQKHRQTSSRDGGRCYARSFRLQTDDRSAPRRRVSQQRPTDQALGRLGSQLRAHPEFGAERHRDPERQRQQSSCTLARRQRCRPGIRNPNRGEQPLRSDGNRNAASGYRSDRVSGSHGQIHPEADRRQNPEVPSRSRPSRTAGAG